MLTYTYDTDGFFMDGVEIPDRPAGVGLPALCTDVTPPGNLPLWHSHQWDGEAWMVVEDHRGRVGHVPGGEAQAIITWGPLPRGWIEGEPEPEPPTRAEALEKAYAAIKQARDQRMDNGGLVWQGFLVSIDKEARDAMTSTAVQFVVGVIDSVTWKMSDGVYAPLNSEAFFAMSTAVGAVVQQCYTVEAEKRGAVDAMGTVEAVLAWLAVPSNLLSGWPTDGAE